MPDRGNEFSGIFLVLLIAVLIGIGIAQYFN